jgi:hypothetical protein
MTDTNQIAGDQKDNLTDVTSTLALDHRFTTRTSFTYTNWRGETSRRHVVPVRVEFGSTKWHPEPQWLLRAQDIDNGQAEKLFAMRDMSDVISA